MSTTSSSIAMASPSHIDDENIMIRVKNIEDRVYCLNIKHDSTIISVKLLLQSLTSIDGSRLRLIYRGKVLQDEETLDSYHIASGQTIHMVVRPENRPPMPSEPTNQTNTNQERTPSILDSLLSGGGGPGARILNLGGAGGADGNNAAAAAASRLLMMSALGNTLRPSATPTIFPGGGVSPARDGPAVSTPESLEHIRQGILTMHTLIAAHPIPTPTLQRRLYDLNNQNNSSSSAAASDDHGASIDRASWKVDSNGKPKFFVGQWLDAKDTVNQWLEATVLAVAVRPVTGSPSAQSRSAKLEVRQRQRQERLNRRRERMSQLRGSDNDSDDSDASDILSDLRDSKDEVNENETDNSFKKGQFEETNVVPSILVHYNGWPARWDEWISPDSPRLAPFRTRTTHPSSQPHMSPSPASNVANAPRTGIDDVRVVLPQIVDMMSTLQTALVTLRDLCDEQDRPMDEPDTDTLKLDETNTGSYVSPFVVRSRKGSFDSSGGGEASVSTSLEEKDRRHDIKQLSQSLSPLTDRFGRLMADLAPHLARLATRANDDPPQSTTADVNTPVPPSTEPSGRQSLRDQVAALRGERGRSAPASSIEALMRGIGGGTNRIRPRSPSPTSTFRLLVSSPPPSNSGNNIDIHIHAILTPLRNNTTGAVEGTSTVPVDVPDLALNHDDDNDIPELQTDDESPVQLSASAQLDQMISDMNLDLPDMETHLAPNHQIRETESDDPEEDIYASMPALVPISDEPTVPLSFAETTVVEEEEQETETLAESENLHTADSESQAENQTQSRTISSIVGMFRRMSSRRGSM